MMMMMIPIIPKAIHSNRLRPLYNIILFLYVLTGQGNVKDDLNTSAKCIVGHGPKKFLMQSSITCCPVM